MIRPAAVAVLLALMSPPSARAETVLLHAAGSLRPAMMDIAATYQAKFGDSVQPKFGASGLLKDEIAGGAKAEVFASANMEHPAALASAGRAGPVVLFVRNRLCALVRPGLAIESGSLLDAMLDPHIKLGTSTPQADPSGDYAWAVFRKAEAMHPGAYAALDAKALKLTGGPATPAAPEGRTIYSVLLEQSAADMFLAYCTSAESAHAENPGQQVIALPEALAVGADYGLTVVAGASLAAYRFALFILSPDAQRIFERHGFTAPNLATDRGR